MRRAWGIGGFLILLTGGALVGGLEWGRVALERRVSALINMPVHIQRITLTPHRLTFHQVSFQSASSDRTSSRPASPLLAVDRLEVEGSLFEGLESVAITEMTLSITGIPLRARGRVDLLAGENGSPRIQGWLDLEHPLFTGRVEVEGSLTEPVLMGWLEFPKWGERRNFVTHLEMKPEEITLSRMDVQGGWQAQGRLLLRQEEFLEPYWMNLQVKGPPGEWILQANPIPNGGEAILQMRRPREKELREIQAHWTVQRSQLDLSMELLQGKVALSGQLDLGKPHAMEMTLDLKGADVLEIMRWMLPPERIPAFSGTLMGKVALNGELNSLESFGELTSRNGAIGREKFTLAALRFQGKGPILKIQNSQLTKPTGVTLIEGQVDLRRIGWSDFFSGVKLSSMGRSVSLNGWEMSPLGETGLRMRRQKPNTQVAVGMSYEVYSQTGPEAVSREEVEVGYRLTEREELNIRIDREGQFVGFKHKNKF